MKIIGGKYKGRNFYMPGHIRPTQNMARKALFDILGHDLEGIEFLELFAGSGAVGLEALSRGAKRVVFVEKDFKCVDVIKENISLMNIQPTLKKGPFYEVVAADTFAYIKTLKEDGQKFDIIFADPPYSRGLAKKTLKALEAYDIVNAASTIIIQYSKDETLPEKQGRFFLVGIKKYSGTNFAMYRISV